MRSKPKYLKRLVLLAFACAILTAMTFAAADETETNEETTLRKLLTAVEVGDYEGFVADGDAAFKAALTKPMFEGVSEQLAFRMQGGYDTFYLGQLNQQGCQVYLWKLVFKDGGDDTLAKLVLKGGKVAGFWLQ
jgi:hypothetical protein